MNIQDAWEKALKKTEIIRPRVQALHTFEATRLPYVFLAESSINAGDTVVRKGEVIAEKPSIVTPFNLPQFQGFDFETAGEISEDFLNTFFLVRGVSFPSFKYNHHADAVNIYEGNLSEAAKHHLAKFQQGEDVHSGLITGPEDVWQFSVLIFVGSQIMRSAEGDFKKLFDDYRRRMNGLN